jgi:hypothetical protein
MRGCLILLLGLVWTLAAAQLRPGPMGGPPPEAINACQGQSEGKACRFNAPLGEIRGQCRKVQEGLVCVPNDHRPPPRVGSGNGSGNMGQLPRRGPGLKGADIAQANPAAVSVTSKVPDTGQGSCFDASKLIPCPQPGSPFYGQDANYLGAAPAYRDNSNGTVTDLVTGLMWQQAHNAKRIGFYAARQSCAQLTLAGYRDWRLPTIKELFSISDFRGSVGRRPYLNDVFEIKQPSREVLEGDRFASTHSPEMMGQTWSATIYTGVHYGRPGVEAAFFFNFLDGRIKQAPTHGRSRLFHRCVRGPGWGNNQFVKRGRNMVEDHSTGLVWQQHDDGKTRDWPSALAYCESLRLGNLKWRLPNVKELETIVDYSRHDPAIATRYFTMTDPKGWFWSSTTLGDNISQAAYVCFGACVDVDGVDVHGAGAERSDPKVGNPGDFGPMGGQRDAVRIQNYVRCVH